LAVARYMTQPPITPDRMLGEASRAQVIYRSGIVHPRHQANFRVFDPLDFLAEVSAQIPDPPCLPAGRCSYRRGRWTGPFRLAPRSLRI